MLIPQNLTTAIEKALESHKVNNLKNNASKISSAYREEVGNNQTKIQSYDDVLAYIGYRMPATYSAIHSALNETLKNCNKDISSLLDVGSGTGAGLWATKELCNLKITTCIERDENMLTIGKNLINNANDSIQTNWINIDAVTQNFNYPSDLVICSYVLNELNDESKINLVDKLWNNTKNLLLIVEPGTP